MKKDVLWELKSDKIIEEIKKGNRVDGRKVDEYRPIQITTDISKNADGSARVKIGETEVIAGIKLLPGEPYPDSPDEGTISVGAERLPLASPKFESGPPQPEDVELARVVDRGIREGKALDFKKLCIEEGKLVWIGFVDFYATNYDGNLFDAAAIASLVALRKTRLPKLENGKIVKGEYSGKLAVERSPLLSTFAKIDSTIVVDPILGEEKAMSARMHIATTEDGYISAFQKSGRESFSMKEIDGLIDIAFKKAKDIRKEVDKAVK